MKSSEIIISVINREQRIKRFNDFLSLKNCYGDKLIIDKLIFDAFEYSPILFFIDGERWTLEDHEIAITLCSLLPKPYLRKHYIENKFKYCLEAYVDVHKFLQTK